MKFRHLKNPHSNGFDDGNTLLSFGDVHDFIGWSLAIIFCRCHHFRSLTVQCVCTLPRTLSGITDWGRVRCSCLRSAAAAAAAAAAPQKALPTIQAAAGAKLLVEGPQQLLSQLSQLKSADQLLPPLPSTDSSSSFPVAFPC